MSISRFVSNRIPLYLAFTLAVGLIITAVLTFPTRSGAKPAPVQEQKVSPKPTRPRFVPGQILVRYRSESIAANRTGVQRITARSGQLFSLKVDNFDGAELVPGLRLAHLSEGETLAAVAALREQPDVLYAEPNYIFKATLTPNDTHYVANRQGNMNTIGAPTAWNTKTGSNSIVVGVIDQGIDTNHLDLQANIWTNPQPGAVGGGISGDLHGYNFVNNNGTVFSGEDGETHGTHVAGIIGAVGNNNKGVTGVNWSVGLMSLKFLDEDGFGDTADAIRACNYAKQMKNLWETAPVHTKGANVRVLNASFGGAGFTQSFLDSLNALNTAGILFVSAAGNSTDDGTREPNNDLVPLYPAGFNAPNILSVAATDQGDNLATVFSHFGATTVDLAAPGENILSTTPHCANPGPSQLCDPSFSDGNGDTYTFFSGTSMSTPHVAGAAALLWAQNPNLTVAQVKNLLMLDGDVQPSLIDKTLSARRLNIGNSFQTLAENDVTAPGAVTNFHINSQTGRTINVGWTTSGDDGANGTAALYQLNFTDGSSGAVIPLKGVVPMSSGSGQIATVSIPYRHTSGTLTLQEFDNAGNQGTPVSVSIGIPQSAGDPYTTAVGSPAGLSTGGTNLNPNADDQYLELILPNGFSFPFFGTTYDTVTLSTNGILYLGDPPPVRLDGSGDDVPSSPGKLGGYRAIAGLWDDLDLRTSSRSDAGIYEVISPNQVIFRWQGVPCNFNGNVCTGGTPVNFEIELNSNGIVRTRYGSGNSSLFPTVGIAGGGPDPYFIPSPYTSEEVPTSLTNAGQVTFTPRATTVSTIQLTASTFSVNEDAGSLTVNVTRSGDTSSFATVKFGTSDTAGPANCSTIGTSASSRCDYLTSSGTLVFGPGETAKSFTIPIVNDTFTENPETFTASLSNPVGATLGAVSSATLTINDGGAETGPNPIDTANFFVRQQYIDFLNREPDSGGLNFWTNEITSCGSDQACIEAKRINVSAAFFLSIEFQETGYLVYRIYKAGLGNPNLDPVPVNFANFLRDTQQIGLGVQVGIGNWQDVLEANKQTFALQFVQRPEFLAMYPQSMTATQVVNQMDANAGFVLTGSDKTTLVNLLGGTPNDLSKRAAVLRQVAENQTLRTAEFNKAFVLMQYFGYLRRSPNDAPDSDFGGFNFWLGKLDQFHGNYNEAEMVKAFIVSGEYRGRFAP
ncbi:MAG TPA: S8 family serine peptidase [Pyrinomonadaceae bacterium]